MTEHNSDAADASPMRISSIDTLRGLTILGMIFVNDLWMIDDTPWWLKHFPGEKDGMTFSDVIFPAFLFIVGMVIPAALTKRLQRGETTGKILAHILKRWLSLLIIGVFMVNMHDAWRGVNLSMGLWSFLTYLSVMMVWHRIAQATTTRRRSRGGELLRPRLWRREGFDQYAGTPLVKDAWERAQELIADNDVPPLPDEVRARCRSLIDGYAAQGG